MSSTMSDEELVTAARGGDRRAADELLTRYEPRIYRFGLRMCANEADARDVLQDTLLAAFRNLGAFRGDARLSTWLFQIARSFCTRQRRLRDGEPGSHERADGPEVLRVAADAAPSDGRVHARLGGEVIQLAIASLPDEAREALVLRDVEGLGTQEAAEVVGVEEAAFKSRLHRARLQLKQKLASVLDAPEAPVECPALAQELAAYAGSDIDEAACLRIEAHLSKCARCTAACESLKQTVSLCRAIPGGQVPMSVQAAVRRAIGLNA
ncbi:MAG: RNA polymerase sigma factor [Archangium sp.]